MTNTALQSMASRLALSPEQLQNIVINTVMPSDRQVTNEQFTSFIAVANEYKLNPLVKEIYAFPTKGGGIQSIVSIDGWLRIITCHKEFDGMTHEDIRDEAGKVVAITCSIYRKDTKHPVVITEYMDECFRPTEPWKKWPIRMLRHKATIQCGRYAFGISGIIDPDEAERYQDAGVIEKEINPAGHYPDDQFSANLPNWEQLIISGKKTPERLIEFISSKGAPLSEEQINKINNVGK